MLRVLLVIEDYGESVFLQILLNKLGFDVATLKNPKILADSIAKFNTDLVVISAKGKRICGIEIASQMRRPVGKPKFIMLASTAVRAKLTEADLVVAEYLLESPVNPPDFLELVCRIHGLPFDTLIEKYKKLKTTIATPDEMGESPQFFQGTVPAVEDEITIKAHPEPQESTTASKWSPKRYQEFLKLDEPPKQKIFPKKQVVELVKVIRAEKQDEQLESQRRDFVKALFKKKA
jgi:CheY-like chemotaxis protein